MCNDCHRATVRDSASKVKISICLSSTAAHHENPSTVAAVFEKFGTGFLKIRQMWTGFWQIYRTILVKDVVHVKRPDYQSIDAVMKWKMVGKKKG